MECLVDYKIVMNRNLLEGQNGNIKMYFWEIGHQRVPKLGLIIAVNLLASKQSVSTLKTIQSVAALKCVSLYSEPEN